MITLDFTQPYSSLDALLFVITGGLLLWMDVKGYQDRGMIREKKWARGLGWMNLTLGFLLFGVRWVYLNWFWQ